MPEGPVTSPTGAAGPRVIVLQPALPAYRAGFFGKLAQSLGDGFQVHYSPTDMNALTLQAPGPWAVRIGQRRRLFPGAEWQSGALSVPLSAGDVIVVPGAPRCLSNILLMLRARLRGAKVIWWAHYWSATSGAFNFRLRMMLIHLAHAVLFYTDQEVTDYKAGPGRRDKRLISALNNGIDVVPVQARRRPYRAADRGSAMFFIGRLTTKSNMALVIQALAKLGDRPGVLHVIGDGPERARFQALADQLQVGDRIVWHGGTADEDRIAEVANQCRFFLYPGAVGLSLIHAMAYGLPALLHDQRKGHMPEIAAFGHDETGLTFAAGEAAALADGMAQMLERDADLDRWSAEAARRADQIFNTDGMAHRFEDLIKTLLRS